MKDEELVKRIQEGEVGVYEELVRRYQDKLQRFSVRFTQSEEDAQEIVLDALFAIYKTIGRVDTKRPFSAYMYMVTKNTAMSYLRKRKRTVSEELLEEIVGQDPEILEAIALEEDKAMVRKAIAKLKPMQKAVIKLYYFEQKAYEEMAKLLAIPVNTIKTHLRRGKMKLRKELVYG